MPGNDDKPRHRDIVLGARRARFKDERRKRRRLQRGAHVVVGTSGLIEDDYAEIDVLARKQRLGVLACGNFALTAVLLQKFAEVAAKLVPQWEIFDLCPRR